MHIVTLITKRSCREIIPEEQSRLYLSRSIFLPGSVIEIIDGNKKSPACVLNCEPVSNYKQEIRSGTFEPLKLRLSKTGEYKEGVVITSYDVSFLEQCLVDNAVVKQSKDPFIKSFFPQRKKIVKKQKKEKVKKVDSFSDLSLDKYFDNKPEHHSRMHELVDTIRNYFGDKARYGQGSFSYYLGFFKRIPNSEIQRMFEEAKRSNKDIFGQKKLFWWKVGQYIKGED